MSEQKEWEHCVLPGDRIWKSHAEYSTRPVIIGTPYYQVTREGDLYHFWELNTDSHKYRLRKTSTDADELIEEGLELDRLKGIERWAAFDPFRRPPEEEAPEKAPEEKAKAAKSKRKRSRSGKNR